jgi:hypothetical protein
MLAASVQPPAPVPGALFQTHAPGEAVRLEVMAQEAGPSEFHFYVAGADVADLAPLLSREVASTETLVFTAPPGMLNPSYWEPHTLAGEQSVRAAGGPVLTRDDQGASWLWRSDSIAPGRFLRDGIDVPVEKAEGAAFKVRGADILRLGKAWAAAGVDAKDKFEWIAFRTGATGDAREDLASFRLRTPGAAMLFSATGDRKFRLVFTTRGPWIACARAALRGYMSRCAGRGVSPPNDKVCEDFLAHGRRGLTSIPDKDFISKGTAFEFTAWPGKTPWSSGWVGDSEDFEERILVYYDRVAGIWAVAS